MKALLLLMISCLALHKGNGAPRTAVYKFVRCNPEGDRTNCVTQQTPEIAWSPELPSRLPDFTAKYLEAEPVEDEKPAWEDDYDEMEEEGTPVGSEEGESPLDFVSEESSGGFEGSAYDGPFVAGTELAADDGSGAYKVRNSSAMKRLLFGKFLASVKPKEQEMKEEHLLQV